MHSWNTTSISLLATREAVHKEMLFIVVVETAVDCIPSFEIIRKNFYHGEKIGSNVEVKNIL